MEICSPLDLFVHTLFAFTWTCSLGLNFMSRSSANYANYV